MGRPQLPPEMIRSKERLMLERQVSDFLREKAVERDMERGKLIEEILLAWCKRQGLRPVTLPPRTKRVEASIS